MTVEDTFIKFAETLSDVSSLEIHLHNQVRNLEAVRKEVLDKCQDGSCCLDLSAHAYKQVSERLAAIAFENTPVYNDVFRTDSPSESLLVPSKLKSFIITMLSKARKKGWYSEDQSKNSDGKEYRFTVDIHKWSTDRRLQFVGIVENHVLKTGFFNWV